MKPKSTLQAAILILVTATGLECLAAPARDKPESWEGLQRVERRGLDEVYIRPGVSLAKYARVMLDPVEVSFDKNWDPKRGRLGFDTADPQTIRRDLADLARDVFRDELEKRGGYQLVTEPGPDVLRVRPQIVDLYINALENRGPGIVDTYVIDAGEMTLVADLLDSQSNTLLAHVKDRERGRDYTGHFQIANRVTNTAEARRVIQEWAHQLKEALDRAKE
jgi:Protein of unknown function (DUF3313)